MSSRWIISARPRRLQDMGDIARIAAADALRMQGVVGDQPPPDLGPALVADGDAITARKHAFDPRDPRRQQAFAASERGGSACIDKHSSFKFQRPADPDLARRDRVRRGQDDGVRNQVQPPPSPIRVIGWGMRPSAITM